MLFPLMAQKEEGSGWWVGMLILASDSLHAKLAIQSIYKLSIVMQHLSLHSLV